VELTSRGTRCRPQSTVDILSDKVSKGKGWKSDKPAAVFEVTGHSPTTKPADYDAIVLQGVFETPETMTSVPDEFSQIRARLGVLAECMVYSV